MEKGCETKSGLTLRLFLAIVAATTGSSFVFGYNAGVLNSSAELIKQWIQNESYPHIHRTRVDRNELDKIWNWIATGLIPPAALGALLSGYMADKLGRKYALMVKDIVTVIGAVLMGTSYVTNLYILLLIGRLISGISCGMISVLTTLYLTEIAPLRMRGAVGSMHVAVAAFGIFISEVFGLQSLLGTDRLWPYLLAFPALPATLGMIALLFCPESPKYLLIIKGKKEKAVSALCDLRNELDVNDEIVEMLDQNKACRQVKSASNNDSMALVWAGVICVVNTIIQHSVGTNAVIYFSSTIFRNQAKMGDDRAVAATIGVGGAYLVACCAACFLIERIGRRRLMLSALAGMFLWNVLLFVSLHLLAVDGHKYNIAAYLAVILVYLTLFTHGFGLASIPGLYANEVFNETRRGKAQMVTMIASWSGYFLVTYTFLPFTAATGEFIFLLYAGASCLGFAFFFTFAPETKGRNSDEILKEVQARMPICCMRSRIRVEPRYNPTAVTFTTKSSP